MFWSTDLYGEGMDEIPPWIDEEDDICDECGRLYDRDTVDGYGRCASCTAELEPERDEEMRHWDVG